MKTFEEKKEGILQSKKALIHRCSQELKNKGLKDFEKKALNMVIRDSQIYLDNIDEVTTINIGATTNSVINSIQTAYKHHLVDYWQDFKSFADKYIVGMTEDGNFKRGSFFAQHECYSLGIGIKELATCFEGRDPMKAEAGNLFRQLINANYGTNIPMEGVEQQALNDYGAVAFGSDPVAKDKAFVHLKEVQRDAGSLQNGGDYYLLVTNNEYQEAKTRLAGKKL